MTLYVINILIGANPLFRSRKKWHITGDCVLDSRGAPTYTVRRAGEGLAAPTVHIFLQA